MITLPFDAPGIGRLTASIVLPPGFRALRFPLPFIVLCDSQNQWTNRGSYGGWHTDTITRQLILAHRLPPTVLVGLSSPPYRDRCYAPPPEGRAGILADHLCNHLIPSIRDRFRLTTDRNRIGILGASFGANFALAAALFRPDTFGLVASFSAAPHFGESLHSMVAKRHALPFHRAYIDCGTLWAYDNPHGFGGDSTQFNRDLMHLVGERLPAAHLRGRVWNGHFHNEEYWRKRIGGALSFLLPGKA